MVSGSRLMGQHCEPKPAKHLSGCFRMVSSGGGPRAWAGPPAMSLEPWAISTKTGPNRGQKWVAFLFACVFLFFVFMVFNYSKIAN